MQLYIKSTSDQRNQAHRNGAKTDLHPFSLSVQNDANCDCYQSGDGYAKDARLNCPSSLVVSPDGTLYVADLGNIRIRAIRRNRPPTGMSGKCQYFHINYRTLLAAWLPACCSQARCLPVPPPSRWRLRPPRSSTSSIPTAPTSSPCPWSPGTSSTISATGLFFPVGFSSPPPSVCVFSECDALLWPQQRGGLDGRDGQQRKHASHPQGHQQTAGAGGRPRQPGEGGHWSTKYRHKHLYSSKIK